MLINERLSQEKHSEKHPCVRAAKADARMVPDAARLRAWVEAVSRPRHAWAEAEDNRRTRKLLCDALEEQGFAVSLQGPFSNVVALPRDREKKPVTLVAAHYDTVPSSPGADDNGSGLAVLLECARLLTVRAPESRVGFVCFNAEEDGLLGSQDFVDNALPVLDRRVRAVHVLEMVGYRRGATAKQSAPYALWLPRSLRTPDFIALLGRGSSNAIVDRVRDSRAAASTRVVTAKTLGPMEKLFPDLARSDHYPFWREGTPAVLWTDTGNFRNPHYHQRTDTPETLDYVFMQGVGELLATLLARDAARSTVERAPAR